MLAAEIMAWTQMIAFTDTKARRWKTKKLRARLFEIDGKIATHARQETQLLASTAPDVQLLLKGMKRVAVLSPPLAKLPPDRLDPESTRIAETGVEPVTDHRHQTGGQNVTPKSHNRNHQADCQP